MSSYIIYKPEAATVDFPAYLERSENGDAITFEKILNNFYGSYEPVTISVPADFRPELYKSVYEQLFLKLTEPGKTWGICEPSMRLPTYSVDGKTFAYVDYKAVVYRDDDYVETGRKIRARFEIKPRAET